MPRDDSPCQLVDHAPARYPRRFPNAVGSYLTAATASRVRKVSRDAEVWRRQWVLVARFG